MGHRGIVMQVRIFSGSKATKVENMVNEFIKDKKVIKLLQSECYLQDNKEWNLTVTVLYENAKAPEDYLYSGISDVDEEDMKIEILGADTY